MACYVYMTSCYDVMACYIPVSVEKRRFLDRHRPERKVPEPGGHLLARDGHQAHPSNEASGDISRKMIRVNVVVVVGKRTAPRAPRAPRAPSNAKSKSQTQGGGVRTGVVLQEKRAISL